MGHQALKGWHTFKMAKERKKKKRRLFCIEKSRKFLKSVSLRLVCRFPQFPSSSVYASIVKNSVEEVPFSFLQLFYNNWITLYNITLWRPNLTHMSFSVMQMKLGKKIINLEFLCLIWTQKKVLKLLATKICWGKAMMKVCFFWSKMGRTKHKPLRTRDFLVFFARNYGLHLEHIIF